MKSIDGILASSSVHVRWLASAVGQIISMSLAIGQVTRLRTRALYAMINSRQSWADRLLLSKMHEKSWYFGSHAYRVLMDGLSSSHLGLHELYTQMQARLGMAVTSWAGGGAWAMVGI